MTTVLQKMVWYVEDGRKFTVKSLSKNLDVSHKTVECYCAHLVWAGVFERSNQGRGVLVCCDPENASRIANTPGSLSRLLKRDETMKKEFKSQVKIVEPVDDTETSIFSEYVSHLNWLLNEYLPHLEAENEKSKQHAAGLMRQMNLFVGVMKTAKVIHNRWVEKENDQAH